MMDPSWDGTVSWGEAILMAIIVAVLCLFVWIAK